MLSPYPRRGRGPPRRIWNSLEVRYYVTYLMVTKRERMEMRCLPAQLQRGTMGSILFVWSVQRIWRGICRSSLASTTMHETVMSVWGQVCICRKIEMGTWAYASDVCSARRYYWPGQRVEIDLVLFHCSVLQCVVLALCNLDACQWTCAATRWG